jgi:hypothetical protein
MFRFEQREKNVLGFYEDEYLFIIFESELLNQSEIKTGECLIVSENNTLTITSKTFEVLSLCFENLKKLGENVFTYIGNEIINISTQHATIINDKNLIIGVPEENIINFEKQLQPTSSQPLTFKAQSFTTSSTVSYINKPPSFSATLYTDANYKNPLFTYKDKQIINITTSILYAQVICNLPLSQTLSNSKVTLTAVFASGLQTSALLSIDSSNINFSGYRATGSISFTGITTQGQNDGTAKLLISVNPLIYQNKFKTQSLVNGGITYSPLPNLQSSGVSSTKYFTSLPAFFSTAGILNQGIVTVGFSTITLNPQFTLSTSFLPNAQSIPGIHTYSYVPILYQNFSQSYNGFVGANCNFGLGVNSNLYPFIESVFIINEDLNTTVNLSNYNVAYNLIYSNNTIQTIQQPTNNLKILNDGTQNYIFSKINWLKYVNPSLGLTSIQFQFTKLASYFPSEVRLYECGLYNYNSISTNFNIQSLQNSIETFNFKPSKVSLDVKEGEIIYGYDVINKSIVETKVVSIRDGIEEPIYRIFFNDTFIELPESALVYTPQGFMNLWNLSNNDEIFSYPEYIPLRNIEIINYKPHKILETDCHNYFADNILIQFQIGDYHKKTKEYQV